MNNAVLRHRSLLIFCFVFVLTWWSDKAIGQWATLDPDNEFTYSFIKNDIPHTFGKTMLVQFEKDEIVVGGKAYKTIKFSIKPSLDIPYIVKDYLYREEGFKIFRRLGDSEELLIDYNAKIGDKFLNDKWEVIQIGILDGKKIVVLETPYGFVRWIEGSGGDLPFFVDASNDYNLPFLCKMINYNKEQEYYNSLLCKKSEIKYIDPSHLWKYDVPGWIKPPTSIYRKFLPDTIRINQRNYLKSVYYDVSEKKWVEQNALYREFGGKLYEMRDNEEETIYNFNFVVGDSIQDDSNGKLVVVKLDTIQTADGKKRRKWTFDKLCSSVKRGSIEWIEGIGTTKGEYYPGSLCIIADPSSKLSCFLENKIPVLNQGNCFDELVGLEESLFNKIEIRPMPVQNYFSVRSEDYVIKEYKILNSLGQVIFSKVVNTSSIDEDISFLDDGVYFLQFKMENHQVVTKKLIKS